MPNGTSNTVRGTPSSLSHLVCLSGTPKEKNVNVRIHHVPIKLFHANQEIGKVIGGWLQMLLESCDLKLPETVFVDGGLDVLGDCLERVRSGEVSGRRLVVRLEGGE